MSKDSGHVLKVYFYFFVSGLNNVKVNMGECTVADISNVMHLILIHVGKLFVTVCAPTGCGWHLSAGHVEPGE